MTHERKPCPFCGNAETHTTSSGEGVIYVECAECGSCGCPSDTVAGAADAWNTRDSLAQPASVPAPLPAPEYSHCDADYSVGHGVGYVQGWNACREATLAAAPQAPQPEAQPIPDVSDLLVIAVECGLIRMSKVMDADLQDALVAFAKRLAAPSAQAEPIAALVDESERLRLYDVPPLAELREKLGGWDIPEVSGKQAEQGGKQLERCRCGYPMPCSVSVPVGFCRSSAEQGGK